jgi:hypothetical protein
MSSTINEVNNILSAIKQTGGKRRKASKKSKKSKKSMKGGAVAPAQIGGKRRSKKSKKSKKSKTQKGGCREDRMCLDRFKRGDIVDAQLADSWNCQGVPKPDNNIQVTDNISCKTKAMLKDASEEIRKGHYGGIDGGMRSRCPPVGNPVPKDQERSCPWTYNNNGEKVVAPPLEDADQSDINVRAYSRNGGFREYDSSRPRSRYFDEYRGGDSETAPVVAQLGGKKRKSKKSKKSKKLLKGGAKRKSKKSKKSMKGGNVVPAQVGGKRKSKKSKKSKKSIKGGSIVAPAQVGGKRKSKKSKKSKSSKK